MSLEKQLEDMYVRDIKELENQITQLRKERDQWKDRCLSAERDKAENRRLMRHV